MQPSIQLSKFNQGLNEVGLNEKSSLNSVHQLELAGGEGQDPADVVGDAQRQQRDDHQQQQHPPEAQVLHELLPGRPEAGQDALCALQVGVQQRVALHRTGTHSTGRNQLVTHPLEEIKSFSNNNLKKKDSNSICCSYSSVSQTFLTQFPGLF